MKIGIDARPLIEKKTGIGYYLKYLLENILIEDKENEYILFSDREVYFDINLYNNVKIVIDDKSRLKKTLWYLFKIDKLCDFYDIDVFWGTQHVLPFGLKRVKKVLTIHDLVAFDFKNTMHTYNMFINKLLIPRSVNKADKIIAVSNSTKERLLFHFKNKCNNKIKVIYEDVNINREYDSIDKNYLSEHNLVEKKYLLFLGTIEPRKNIKTLIKALEIISKNSELKLVICGKYGWNCEEEKKLIQLNEDKIIFLNYISDVEKDYLMNKAFAFVLPSIYEGFGLPILEAMRNGTISIVANNTSLKEIVDKDCLRFETMDYEDLAEKVLELYKNNNLYKNALDYCKKREKDFNWNNISKEYLKEFTVWRE